MTVEELRAKVREWDSQNVNNEAIADAKYTSILDQIEYHAVNEWRRYIPAEHTDFNSNYIERLAAWIGNLTSEVDQKLLLEYALHISFFSHDDFVALYQTALNREISNWIAVQVGAELNHLGGQGFHDLVYQQIHSQTWYCPVTDSMDINEFYKVNHLTGKGHRPGFASLQMMAEHPTDPNPNIVDDWIRYMVSPDNPQNPQNPPLERLVLLEDVVGSGTQCLNAVRWAVENLGKPVLFIPLILCPNGVDALRAEESKWKDRLMVRPVIELRRSDLLGPERQGNDAWSITPKLENLAQRCAVRASVNMDTFGYKNTGCSLVTFSNAPDNSLPIIHNNPRNGNWAPLFPRIHRD